MRKSWVGITARSISIVILGLGCLIPLASPLADQTKRTISILALDGISWTANVFTDSPVYDFADRDLPYLEPAFRGAWGDFARIQTISWNGDISDTEETLDLIKTYLPALAHNAKTKSRFFVVVGHSWGTLLAYRAIKELSAEGMIEAGDIDQLVTLGSPLTSQVPLIKGKIKKYGDWTGTKPITDVVREWRNYVIEEDLFTTVIAGLNESDNGENIILPLHPGVIPKGINAHRQYYENQLFLDTIGLHIRNSTQKKSEPVAQHKNSGKQSTTWTMDNITEQRSRLLAVKAQRLMQEFEEKKSKDCAPDAPKIEFARYLTSDPSESSARDVMEYNIFCQSQNVMQLVQFQKTDGQKRINAGVEYYVLFFTAQINFQTDAWWHNADARWFFFSEYRHGKFENKRPPYLNWVKWQAGEAILFKGSVAFEKSERGWLADLWVAKQFKRK